MSYRPLTLVFSVVLLTSFLTADTLILKNGSTIHGRFIVGDETAIRFASGNHQNTYEVEGVDSIKFVPHAAAQTPSTPSPKASHPVTSRIAIPSGTEIVVRLIDPVDSKQDRLGQTYRASVDRPMSINGETLIPRGSDAIAVLSEAQQSGKFAGNTTLAIALRSVTVNGRSYDLDTSSVLKSSGSRGRTSGRRIGGGAAAGAIIGGIAGGGKGAAIGAASGGGVGAVAQVATSGERVKIPSETMLTFILRNPFYLQHSLIAAFQKL